MAERHLGVSRGPQRGGVGTGSRPSAGVEGDDRPSGVHEDEQVATETAQVGRRDGHRGVGGDRRVDRVAAAVEGDHAGLRRDLVGGGDHRRRTPGRSDGGSVIRPRISRYVHRTLVA